MATHDSGGMSKAAFNAAFPALREAILSEWSELDEAALDATSGELDKVVTLVSERTSHTRTLARRQIEEIFHVVNQPPPQARTGAAGRARRPGPGGAGPGQAHGDSETGHLHVDQLLEELERRTAHVMRELRGGFFDNARASVREHTIFSLIISVGLGFIVGVLFTGFNRAK